MHPSSKAMSTALKAVDNMFAQETSVPFDQFFGQHSMAIQVFMNPDRYEVVPRGYCGEDIYVERRTQSLRYDKHFWVKVSEVEEVREYFRRPTEGKTAAHR